MSYNNFGGSFDCKDCYSKKNTNDFLLFYYFNYFGFALDMYVHCGKIIYSIDFKIYFLFV